jgi:hypothetical protein
MRSSALRPSQSAAMFPTVRGLSRIFALLAAIMLVIGGAPMVASAQSCDPCPPDCPMMKQLSAEQAANHGAPAKGGKADNPCQQMVACQTITASVAPSEQVTLVALSAASVTHEAFDPLATPSRPPDRSLRPPIHI